MKPWVLMLGLLGLVVAGVGLFAVVGQSRDALRHSEPSDLLGVGLGTLVLFSGSMMVSVAWKLYQDGDI